VLSDGVGRILSVEPPVSPACGLIALPGPERSGRRGGRSGRLGRAPRVERAHRVRADRRDRPLARTTTRRRILPPWSSREGRGSRGVGVHRSSREGPDWPVRPHPSWDASCSSGGMRRVLSSAASSWRSCPAGSAERSLDRRAVIPSRFASCLTAPGAEIRRRSEADSTVCLGQLRWKAFCVPFCVPFAGRDRRALVRGACKRRPVRKQQDRDAPMPVEGSSPRAALGPRRRPGSGFPSSRGTPRPSAWSSPTAR
jgi:hypothetical protein